jgi:hypothetical protein
MAKINRNQENQGMKVLMTSYLHTGNAQAATAVGEMYAQTMQQMLGGSGKAYLLG